MVAARPQIIDQGDVVWVNFNPTRGHEQRGRRPALVVSPKIYNAKTGLALVCPITAHVKGYPFEVPISIRDVTGVVLSDHIRSLDWKERKVEKIQKAPDSVLREVQQHLRELLVLG
jgi:mRNA interferase MazF